LERLEQERLERARLQESFAQKLREQEKIDQEKQEQKRRELDRRKGERQRRERREQGRWEQEKTIESEGGLAAESTEQRPTRRQVSLYSPSLISASSLLQDPTPLAHVQGSGTRRLEDRSKSPCLFLWSIRGRANSGKVHEEERADKGIRP